MRRTLPVLSDPPAPAAPVVEPPADFARSSLPRLTDGRGRQYTYARISLTDRCDMACVYCMPPGGELDHAVRSELMSFEEVATLVSTLSEMGVSRVRFTGGEPTVRKDIVRLVELTQRRAPDVELVMTTNASRLDELAVPLARAGLRGVNVSLDSLDAERFGKITRGGSLPRVLAGLHAARDVGLELKLNTVPMRGVNDDELADIVEFAFSLDATPRFIELMPLGAGAELPSHVRITRAEVIEILGHRLREEGADDDEPQGRPYDRGPARYLRWRDTPNRRVGFITPISDTFCDSCNRVRFTARGELRACLASRSSTPIKDILRAGGGRRELAWSLLSSLGAKSEGHGFNDPTQREHEMVGMSLIGG